MIPVNPRKQRALAVALGLGAALATGIPYLLSARNAPPNMVFSGFMMNPVDGFSYLAKMRQGLEGYWLFRLPYSAEPGAGALLFTFHILLGHIARLVGSDLLLTYHLARLVSAWAMFAAAYLFLEEVLTKAAARWAAFLMILLGSGLGWIASAFGLFANDLWVPESIPLLSAYANAHFPAAAALLLLALRMVLKRQIVRAAILAFALSIIQPFAVITLVGALIIWVFIEFRIDRAQMPFQWRDLAPMIAGTAPVLAYDLWLTSSHEALSVWTAQNVTPTPAPLETALGFGLVLALAAIGVFRAVSEQRGRLMILWVVLGFGLLYMPVALQRRMVFGLFFPLAVLAAIGMVRLWGKSNRFGLALAAVIVLIIPSNLVVMAAGIASAQEEPSPLLMSADELAAYVWMSANLPKNALVLAGPESGNRIPAFASLRVMYGHPFETPYAEQQEGLVTELYSAGDVNQLRSHGINFVLMGPRERAMGDLSWLETLERIYQSGSVQIFELPR